MNVPAEGNIINQIDDMLRELMLRVGRASGGNMIDLIDELKLTLPQLFTLDLLAEAPQTVSGLAATLRITPGAVSRLVDRLVRLKLVSREEGEDDRRRKTLSLTPAGSEVRNKLREYHMGSFSVVMNSLPLPLLEELNTVLLKVVTSLGVEESVANPERSGEGGGSN